MDHAIRTTRDNNSNLLERSGLLVRKGSEAGQCAQTVV
jgi:hypothetical protein